ncbi:ubiquitin-associated (UBA)/TS-N domain-containing protein / octicosapeptide/Phox/Bemp1 (PB1) domain-containing protein [Striga hermonthica]|uniref:Ubiquitin-associated (UBA)/TS-N domain-containing protein / octicosapeptide/Phox/Bemp1 (PB1) domain-containing protein n=1 Tax=Striga hermonthica TaxID=68872 RepID=A0A9N7NQT6_STRHE|nr:ubiquitin-associated (UBA)/TS-N domain-containing protein / octicosapeptide/Phox/Bemp1 (PB1) domain-containing protein [Striga hermonthica]
MAHSSSMVIKVKYGDSLRRFSAKIVGDELNFTMDGLRKKILSVFSFGADAELILTYVDEDGDAVTLADDEDLRDAVRQDLNPLRITVKVTWPRVQQPHQDLDMGVSEVLRTLPGPLKETLLILFADLASKASSTECVQQSVQNLNIGVSQILKTVSKPLAETLVKLSSDLASKASSSAPCVLLVDHLSKLGLSYLDQLLQTAQPGSSSFNREGGIPESDTAAKEIRDLGISATSKDVQGVRSGHESSERIKPKVTLGSDEVKVCSVDGGSNDKSAENINVTYPGSVSLPNSGKPDFTSHGSRKNELFKKSILNKTNGKSHLNNPPIHLENNVRKSASPAISSMVPPYVSNPGELKVEPKPANFGVADPTMDDCVDNRVKSDDLGNTLGPFSTTNPGNCYIPDQHSNSVPTYHNPSFGLVMGNGTAGSQPAAEVGPLGWHISQNNYSANIFHPGVRCDGCRVYPITGPRFKSKVKMDYDLCSICFGEMGNQSDYIRMDRPAIYRPHNAQGREWNPSLQQQVLRSFEFKPVAGKPDSLFICDVNIFDNTVIAPSTPFTKIWRMKNTGNIPWPKKTQLVWIGGDKMSNELTVEVKIPATGLKVDEELDVTVDFISPKTCGRYASYWRMALPSGQTFGQRFWVVILVDTSLKEFPRENVRDLNLNLPPASSSFAGSEIINVEPVSMVEDDPSGAKNLKKSEKLELQPNVEQELKFPIDNSLLVGDDLRQAVDELSGVADWDPILEALQDMGFHDTETNKMLLKKNNGSIKRVVMDLIAGEKIE